ncbi:hypothetical protein BH24CHL3_BH24CHL3_07290 [soil metagenome]
MPNPNTSLWKIRRTREQSSSTSSGSRSGFFVPLPSTTMSLAALAVVLFAVVVLAWQLWPREPGGSSAEAGFLRDMFEHHSQAVAMAMIIRDRTDDPELFAMATDIALTQSTQMGAMQGYLDIWGLPLSGQDAPMTWMDHSVDGLMPGMAATADVQQLSELPVADAEVLFLQLLIRHHQGGVEMAEAYLERGSQAEVTLMADRIVLLQNAEIDVMNDMLERRGESPITDPLPDNHEDH